SNSQPKPEVKILEHAGIHLIQSYNEEEEWLAHYEEDLENLEDIWDAMDDFVEIQWYDPHKFQTEDDWPITPRSDDPLDGTTLVLLFEDN
ncbi:hypothetical protein, partial [Enterococcus faecalis]|uniref:hypothetical protein n=1 Tax=Enterococcus faecalis TaxID=1351 RepID=UPI003D6A8140